MEPNPNNHHPSELPAAAVPNPAPLPPPLPPTLPPVIPPVLPEAASIPIPASVGVILQGRLHPVTLLLTLWQALKNFFIPLIIVVFLGRRDQGTMYYWVMVMVGISLLYSLVRYFTFTYRIQNGELVTTQGLLGRLERKIPLTRVQDVRLEQGLIHRFLRVVELQVETAGGKGAEASLSVLSMTEAERLRTAIFSLCGRAAQPVDAAAAASSNAGSAVTARPAVEIIRQLSLRDLVYAGLTSNYIASALLILLVAWQQLDEILPQKVYEQIARTVERSVVQASQNGGEFSWLAALALAAGVLVVGLIFSVAGSVVLFHGFTLSRSGEDLHRAYGLFTRRASSLPRRRIQSLKIEEPWLRRIFKLATLRADTAGSAPGESDEKSGGRDALVPIAPRGEIDPLLPVFLPELTDEPAAEWRQVSRRAIRRGTVKGALVVLLLTAAACALQRGWEGLVVLALLPLVYYLNVQSFRHLGYRLGANFFWARQGWLSRATHLVPIRNAQVVVVTQTPLDRWHRVASVLVDTAGQAFTGGGPHIANVPAADAVTLARNLAQTAARHRYRT